MTISPDTTSDGPLFLFGGPYSNLEATAAALSEAARLGVPPHRVVCTGDVVAYGADAKACVDLVRGAGIHVVMGNCEEQLAAGEEDCGCGFAPGSACDRLSAAWFAHASRELGPDDRAWMAALPRRLDVQVGGLTLAVIHGSLDHIARFVFPSTPARVKALDLEASGVDGIVAGHSGLPFSQVIEGRLWHNPGAVGMPANDGCAEVWFSLLTPGAEPRSVVIEHRRLEYGWAVAAAKMRAAGLPEGYAAALGSGLWPSCDALPPSEARRTGRRVDPGGFVWRRDADDAPAWPVSTAAPRLAPEKFQDGASTARGEPRATVELSSLRTLWMNTGTRCNLACANCYIESTPRNDRLVYLTAAEASAFLDEAARDHPELAEVGFTGGEPFMNPDLMAMVEDALARGHRALVLTNAMRPMQRLKGPLLALKERYGRRLTLRVSLDHYDPALHELERGPRSFQPTLDGMKWLADHGFALSVAGRLFSGEAEGVVRAGFARLFDEHGVPIDAADPVALTLFPEMDAGADVPEITTACWGLLGVDPRSLMCSSSRMVVKRKGADRPAVLACTLLAYDERFELGATLSEASRPVALNHPHCATFCVLGGGACSAG
ncbi:radical SAM protein [Methylopila sp. Yamaguchi]|uniref:radical SAM protein n=1 Tax=Methylopila sp. Yamaguchi TaxID=1437817 RepID=UPI000CB0B68D|nr:radical SAM protein [Methylopila sp. Yamaguchi]GBD48154.1 hypothetical protein METY_1367 [Methylopila sp. Yamaguchi]